MSIFIKAGLWLEKKTGYKGEFNLTKFVENLIATSPSGQSYKVYTALLNQADEEAPVPTVLENTLGGTPVWTRDGLGYYECTLAGAFPVDKTFCNITIGQDYGNFGTIFFGRSGDNIVNIYYRLYNNSNGIDFNNNDGRDVYVEIRVYN